MNLKLWFYVSMALMLTGACRAESTATAPLFRLETRESFGGRLAYGQTPLSATVDGVHTGSVAGAGASGSFTIWNGGAGSPVWDTAQRADGWYALTLTTATNTLSASLAVLNSAGIAIREGTLASDASWTSNAVNVVRHWVVVPPGRTLTLEPGSVLKFTENTGIQVDVGGTLDVRGATLTHVADDIVGGDTNMDGSQSQPTNGEWIAGSGAPTLACVGFDAQGGEFQPNRFFTAGQAYGWLPMPARMGYAFAGWWTEPGGTGSQVSVTTVVPYVTTGHTLYAAWSAVQQKVVTPVISPTNGTVFTTSSKRVTITCATEGAAIRFTTNGVDPTVSSALYSSSFNVYATTTVKARAFKSGMTESEIAVATITKPLVITLSDALDVPDWTVTTGGDGSWMPEITVTHDGADAARTGAIGALQTTWMETSVTGAGTLTFWWRASCEDSPDDNWDYLMFTVDGVEEARVDGDSGWQQVSVALPSGDHTLRWTYVKDDADEIVFEDCGWVDQVIWMPAGGRTSTTEVPVPYSWLDQFGLVSGGDYEAAAWTDADGDGHMTWQEYVAGTVPTNAASVFTASIMLSNGVRYVTWTPDLGTERVYTIKGKASLADTTWGSPTNSASRFFRVTVSPK